MTRSSGTHVEAHIWVCTCVVRYVDPAGLGVAGDRSEVPQDWWLDFGLDCKEFWFPEEWWVYFGQDWKDGGTPQE